MDSKKEVGELEGKEGRVELDSTSVRWELHSEKGHVGNAPLAELDGGSRRQ
jgi:hypothetical protein